MVDMLPCMCCGHKFIDPEDGYDSYDICPVCGWEDDVMSPDERGGANIISLNEARAAFKQGGGEAVKALDKAEREALRAG